MASDSELTLNELFEQIWKFYEKLENTNEAIKSENIQKEIKDKISKCQLAINLINKLELFSINEQFEDLTTNDIKFILIPAFLGYIENKNCEKSRKNVVERSKLCYENFLRLTNQYQLTNYKFSNIPETNDEEIKRKHFSQFERLQLDSSNRQKKIDQYKAKVQMEKDIKSLREEVEKPYVDEEVKRKYYLKLVQKWALESEAEIESFDMEQKILEEIEKRKESGEKRETNEERAEKCMGHKCREKGGKKNLHPFIITRDHQQKAVFGLGYPGVPTVSVDEFYDERVRKGLFPQEESCHMKGIKRVGRDDNKEEEEKKKEEENEEKELKEEKDDEEALMKARGWDEYKDTHRRGWGNTYNKG